MKKSVLFILTVSVFLALACSRSGDRFTHKSARDAAQRFYSELIEGRYEKFVEAQDYADSMPQSYHEQMSAVMKLHVLNIKGKRGGIISAEATADTLIECDSSACVFLNVLFSDSLTEQICIPLVFRQNRWKLR